VPNIDWLGDNLERARFGEIVVDSHGATSVPGVFGAIKTSRYGAFSSFLAVTHREFLPSPNGKPD